MLYLGGMKKRTLRYVVANFKMNPESPTKVKSLAKAIKTGVKKATAVHVVLAPSHVHISAVAGFTGLKLLSLGAQDAGVAATGAHTGDVSPTQLKQLGVKYVLLGHSERRARGEDNALINKRVHAALAAGLTPIVCIGEQVRDKSGAYLDFLKDEIEQSLNDVSPSLLKRVLVAYEPVWAIGKAPEDAMRPTDVHETVLFIRKVLTDMTEKSVAFAVPILYGGSVSPENAQAIITEGMVDGLLVGHASLDASLFTKIVSAVHDATK